MAPTDPSEAGPYPEQDVDVVIDLEERGRLEAMSRAASSPDLTAEELREIVPPPVLRALFALSGPNLALTKADAPDERRERLDRASAILQKHFGDLLSSEAAALALRDLFRSARTPSKPSPLLESMKVISGMSWASQWLGELPELLPMGRVSFLDGDGQLLLDSTLDWDDLAYVLSSLGQVLMGLMDKGRYLAEQDQLDLDRADRVAKRLSELQDAIGKIRDLCPLYGIDPQSTLSRSSEED